MSGEFASGRVGQFCLHHKSLLANTQTGRHANETIIEDNHGIRRRTYANLKNDRRRQNQCRRRGGTAARFGQGQKQHPTTAAKRGVSNPRWFRVRVTDTFSGRNKVNVNIPFGLVNVGLKMGARFVPDMEDGKLQELLVAVRSGQQGKVIDVTDEESGERVEIFVE